MQLVIYANQCLMAEYTYMEVFFFFSTEREVMLFCTFLLVFHMKWAEDSLIHSISSRHLMHFNSTLMLINASNGHILLGFSYFR